MHLPVVPVSDRFGRSLRYLRISVTDRCNYRCQYCMPADGVEFLPKSEVMTFEEITRLAAIFAGLGVERIRVTGGEPTVRKDIDQLILGLAQTPRIAEVVMTTNGHRLAELAEPLFAAGLKQVNVSLDTLDPDKFRSVTRGGDVTRVKAGIVAAKQNGLVVKLNAVVMRGANEGELAELCQFAWDVGATPRFIEMMPMSDGAIYGPAVHVSAEEIRQRIGQTLGVITAAVSPLKSASSGPARYFTAGDETREFGIISAISEHFCDTCNRVRLSSVGDLHTCLAFDDATPLGKMMRHGETDDGLRSAILAALGQKRTGHEFTLAGAGAPRKHMISIGG